MNTVREFSEVSSEPAVRGFLHEPAQPNGDALVLTHGAGANCQIEIADRRGHSFRRCRLPGLALRSAFSPVASPWTALSWHGCA